MATQSITSKSKRTELDTLLSAWESRYKLQVLTRQLPRAIIVGLVISMIIGVIGYSQRLILAENLAIIALVIIGLSALLMVLYVQFVPRPRELSARYFDVEFGLKERVSTAFELLDGRIQTHPEIESIQITDALVHANNIDASDHIAMDFRRIEIIALVVLLVGLLAMIIIPMVVGQYLTPETPSVAVQAAREDVRDITEAIATDTDLDEVDREELLNALEIALERLEEEDITDEEAFAAMSQLESQIEEVENELLGDIELDQSGLNAAEESLGDFTPPDNPESGGEDPTGEGEPIEGQLPGDELAEALEELSQNADSLTEEEREDAISALEQAAEDLAQSNPELSEALQNMADALEGNDPQTAQQEAQNAQEQLQQQQQELQQNSNAQQNLSDLSDLAEQANNEIAQQQQSNQPNNAEQPSPPQEGEAESSDNPSSNDGQQSEEGSDTAQQGDAQGNQQPQQNMPGEAQPSDQNSQTAGQGAGEGESDNQSMEGSGGEDQGAETDNQTTGDGISQFEAIYNPTGIEGGGANEVQLESDASEETLAEGDFEDNPLGQSRVTYDTVFNDYQDAANRALESDYVPLGLRDVVRDYFTSLEPTGNESE